MKLCLLCRMCKYSVFKYKISIIIDSALELCVRDDCELNPACNHNMK